MPIQRKADAPASGHTTVLVPLTTTTPAGIKLSSTGIVLEPGWTYVLNSDGNVERRGSDGHHQFVRFAHVVRRAGWEYALDVDGDIVGVPCTAKALQSVDAVRARGAAVMARQAAVEARTAKKKKKQTPAQKTPARKTPAQKKPAKKTSAKKPAKKSATTTTKRQQAQHQRQ